MRTFAILAAWTATARAEATWEDFDACEKRRDELTVNANATTDPEARVAIFRSRPVCVAPPSPRPPSMPAPPHVYSRPPAVPPPPPPPLAVRKCHPIGAYLEPSFGGATANGEALLLGDSLGPVLRQ